MNTSRIDSYSALIPISHVLAKSESALQDNSWDSLSFCFRLISFYRSNMMFAGFTNADLRISKIFLNGTDKIFILECLREKLFPMDPKATYRLI